MPSERFHRLVAIMLVTTMLTYLAEPYLGIHSFPEFRPATPFSIPTIDNGTFSLDSSPGRVVLLDFMATWCPPCKTEMGELKALRASHPPANLTIVTMDVDYSETADQLRAFRLTFGGFNESVEGSGWYFALDNADVFVAPRYGANALPTLVLIDAQGAVRHSWVGITTAAAIGRAIGEVQM